ncbi:hypothetical protein GCM10027321_05710 [Massilia terrae]
MAAGPVRAAWLLTCLRLRRLANMVLSRRFRGKGAPPTTRSATRPKRRLSGVLGVVLLIWMLFAFEHVAHQAVLNMHCGVTPGSLCAADTARLDADAIAAWEIAEDGVSEPLARAVAFQLSLLLVASFLMSLGSREIAQADWDLEWLVTLPIKRGTLLAGRIVERSIANPSGWFMLLPTSVALAWLNGLRWSAPLAGIVATLALLPLTAVLRTVVDTGLRMTLSPSRLRNLQALCSIATLPFLYLAMSFGMPAGAALIRSLGRGLPQWLMWTPPGLAVRAITAGGAGVAAASIAALLAEVALFAAAGVWVLGRQLRDGVVSSGVREAARRIPRQAQEPSAFWRRLLPRSPVQRRELRLLSRDRNFLVQSLLMPVVIVGSQVVLNGKLNAFAAGPVPLALTAWGISSYMLMLSAFQTLNNEGQALWMLYTFPATIEEVLKDKAKMWAVLALVYPLLILAFGLAAAPAFEWRLIGAFAVVLAGLPLFSAIAVALGVFACDPLAQDVRSKVRPSYVYLYMMLAAMYGYAIYAEKWFQALVVMVLTAGLAQALWQKSRDALPYLLDPSAAPPARVSTADGMMAAMLFFVLQVLGIFLLKRARVDTGLAMTLSFVGAGAIVYALVRLAYRRSRTAGVPAILAGQPLQSLAWGLGAGLAAACVGVAYLYFLKSTPWFVEMAQARAASGIQAAWLVALAVLAAPLFEEFIFRGLVFGGLRRSGGLLPSMVLSAGLFAIVHPPVSMLPVFVLGLCTAYAYERCKGLLAPMLVHAVYNAVIVGWQLA